MLHPGMLGSYREYGNRYCITAQQPTYRQPYPGEEYMGASNLEELSLVLGRTIMLRRTKAQVAQQLPPKIRCVQLLERVHSPFLSMSVLTYTSVCPHHPPPTPLSGPHTLHTTHRQRIPVSACRRNLSTLKPLLVHASPAPEHPPLPPHTSVCPHHLPHNPQATHPCIHRPCIQAQPGPGQGEAQRGQ